MAEREERGAETANPEPSPPKKNYSLPPFSFLGLRGAYTTFTASGGVKGVVEVAPPTPSVY